jgi:Flp pilus assembly protein TadG
MRKRARLLPRLRSESGAELIEFALALPLLLLVVLGIIDFGFLFQKYEVITNAAREGARIAVLPNYTTANAKTRVGTYLTAAGLTDPAFNLATDVTVTGPTPVSVGGGKCVFAFTVQVNYPHAFSFVGGIATYFGGSLSSTSLTATSTMRGEAVAGVCPPGT